MFSNSKVQQNFVTCWWNVYIHQSPINTFKVISMMVALFVLGCTGVVMLLHGVNFIFHLISQHFEVRSISFLGVVGW